MNKETHASQSKLSEGRISLQMSRDDILKTGVTAATLSMFQAIRDRAFNARIDLESDANGLLDLQYSAERLLGSEAVRVHMFDDNDQKE